jgi:hypothetical protein
MDNLIRFDQSAKEVSRRTKVQLTSLPGWGVWVILLRSANRPKHSFGAGSAHYQHIEM